MSEKWYVVPDLELFADKARAIVYNNFGMWQDNDELDILIDDIKDQDQEEFNKVLSHQESLVIIKELVKKQKNKKTKEIRYAVNDTIFADIVYKLNDRMVSNIVNGLVQRGLVESAFDNETNDFVFWIKDTQEEEEKPETD
jgi:DNA-binding HxlR family transcriptional regulator